MEQKYKIRDKRKNYRNSKKYDGHMRNDKSSDKMPVFFYVSDKKYEKGK